MAMEAKIKKIAITPAHFDKDGDIDRDEYGTLTFDIPLDSVSAKQAFIELFNCLDREYVKVDVNTGIGQIPGTDAEPKVPEV